MKFIVFYYVNLNRILWLEEKEEWSRWLWNNDLDLNKFSKEEEKKTETERKQKERKRKNRENLEKEKELIKTVKMMREVVFYRRRKRIRIPWELSIWDRNKFSFSIHVSSLSLSHSKGFRNELRMLIGWPTIQNDKWMTSNGVMRHEECVTFPVTKRFKSQQLRLRAEIVLIPAEARVQCSYPAQTQDTTFSALGFVPNLTNLSIDRLQCLFDPDDKILWRCPWLTS